MVAIGRAMMSNPAILTLDEPSLGLSPLLSKELFQSLRAVRDTGIGILLVEQNAKASLAIADRGYLLENTEIIHEDAAANLAKDPAVQKAYLGGAAAKDGAGKAKPQANAMPAPSAPRPAKGPSPSDIAAQAMSGLAPARPAKPAPAPEPAPRPAPPPAPPVARPAPRPAPAATPTPTGIDTASIVAKAASQSSRRNGPPALPPRPAPMPEPPKPARASQPTRPMPDLGHHSDRLREVLTEIETAAQRARDRSRTRTRGKP